MSQPNEHNGDDLRDRLMDQALGEVLGGETPPDLSADILAAVEKQVHVSPQPKEQVMDRPKYTYRWWALVGIAACLMVAVSIALLVPALRMAAQRSPHQLARNSEVPTSEPSVNSRAKEAIPSRQPRESGERNRVVAATGTSKSESKTDAPTTVGMPSTPKLAGQLPATPARPVASSPADSPSAANTSSIPLQSGSKPSNFPNARRWGYSGAAASEKRLAEPKNLMMMVTPRIVVAEEEEEQLVRSSPTGQGPGRGGDKYDRLVENPFQAVKDHPLSTFSIDVDTASYANVRRFLLSEGRLPPPDAVRIEELINYFDYDYAGPKDDVPFAAHIEVAACPWAEGHRLVRIGLKGKEIPSDQRPECNLVFLLDVSGSMDSPAKLPLLKAGMKLLAGQLRDNDRVAIVVYAGSEGLVLPSTFGSKRAEILAALDDLQAGGSTNGGAGIALAYRIAKQNFVPGGVNRVLLCTDGDFNVGTTSTGDLVRMVEKEAKSGVFLSVLGFGRGNLNDSMMETISNKGNGNYAYVDNLSEARKVLVRQMGGTLVTIAKDVKIQVEFNPAQVAAYRLIGYENRMLAAEDFNDDKKDAGEIGAGHTVTALYELVPAGQKADTPPVDPLKYQDAAKSSPEKPGHGELLTLKLRYKAPDAETSKRLEFPVVDLGEKIGQASRDFQFAASVAAFGMLLRGSEHKGTATYDAVLEMAASAKGPDPHGYRAEFLELVRRAKAIGRPKSE